MESAAALTDAGRGVPNGCMLTLSSFDRDEHVSLCETVRASRNAVVQRLETRFARARAEGEIRARSDLHALARFVQAVLNGMSILARDGAPRAELESVARVAMAGWDATSRRAGRGAH